MWNKLLIELRNTFRIVVIILLSDLDQDSARIEPVKIVGWTVFSEYASNACWISGLLTVGTSCGTSSKYGEAMMGAATLMHSSTTNARNVASPHRYSKHSYPSFINLRLRGCPVEGSALEGGISIV